MQKVIRTYGDDFVRGSNINSLQKLLDEGYKVIFITKNNDIIEYILQKD